ncbi:MAG: nucleotidyltransferase [Armatimonadetes bacterium RBG_16_58_9]|nr:MAG: nucleotidyltransferase [Armatimonadetes bacterium RBG_16_58_9]
MRDDRERLLDILEAIEKIEERTMGDKELFQRDEMVQVWVLYHVQIIGEAAGRISESLRNRYRHVPWPDVVAMRNLIAHHYFGVDLDQIWDAVTNDLPTLKAWTTQMLEDV